MNIKSYLTEKKLRPTPWAISNGISPAVMSRMLRGGSISKHNALAISRATGGEVTVMELLFPDQTSNTASRGGDETQSVSSDMKPDFNSLIKRGYRRPDVIWFLLRANGITATSIAKKLGISLSEVCITISGKRDNKETKRTISQALGFDPWA